LRRDLAAWNKTLDGDIAEARDRARRTLLNWQGDPDLAGLREPAELNKLAVDERKACLTLWAEVAAVLARTQK